jgi:hypothetical protein
MLSGLPAVRHGRQGFLARPHFRKTKRDSNKSVRYLILEMLLKIRSEVSIKFPFLSFKHNA